MQPETEVAEVETDTPAEDDGPPTLQLPPRDMVARLLEAHAASYEAARLMPASIARTAFLSAFGTVAKACGPFEAAGLRYDWNNSEGSISRKPAGPGANVVPSRPPPAAKRRGEAGASVRLYPRGGLGRNFH